MHPSERFNPKNTIFLQKTGKMYLARVFFLTWHRHLSRPEKSSDRLSIVLWIRPLLFYFLPHYFTLFNYVNCCNLNIRLFHIELLNFFYAKCCFNWRNTLLKKNAEALAPNIFSTLLSNLLNWHQYKRNYSVAKLKHIISHLGPCLHNLFRPFY